MDTQVCSRCGVEKPLTDDVFPIRNRGKARGYETFRSQQCVPCMTEVKRACRDKKPDKYRQTKRALKARNPEKWKEYHHDYYQSRRDEMLEAERKRAATPEGREIRNLASRRYRGTAEGSLKEKCRGKLNKAVAAGTVVKPNACEQCTSAGAVEGHHDDYAKPLDVVWLCKTCHESKHHLNEGHSPDG